MLRWISLGPSSPQTSLLFEIKGLLNGTRSQALTVSGSWLTKYRGTARLVRSCWRGKKTKCRNYSSPAQVSLQEVLYDFTCC